MKNMNRCINSLPIIANKIIEESRYKGNKTMTACNYCAYKNEACWSMNITCAEGIIKKLMEQHKHEYSKIEI